MERSKTGERRVSEVTYLEAIRQALFDAMASDDAVFCIGEDIGHFGGAFKVTRGLADRFGVERVIDTPIAESAIMGTAIGAAIRGMRPVAEMQFADFVSCGFSQLVNNAGTFHYRLGVSVPMVVRLPSGGGIGAGPFHSRNPDAWFCHAPGLKVVAPTTPEDAYGLMRSAIDDPDPVIFLEQKYLYRRAKANLPEHPASVPLGSARTARSGEALTVLSYANGVELAMRAADDLAGEGASVEVIDLRSLVPWDHRAVRSSVEKTGRVVIVEEAFRTASFGAELAANVAELCFESLDAPVRRVSAPDVPIPARVELEQAHRPSVDQVKAVFRDVLSY